MTKLLTLLALVSTLGLFTGCSSITGVRTAPGGQTLSVSSHRLLWASEGIDAAITDTNGFTFSLKVQKSATDSAALAAVTEAAVKGAVQGAK